MHIVIYKNNKIKKILSFNSNVNTIVDKLIKSNILTSEDKYKVFDNIKNMAVEDIRAINDDGSIKSLGEQIKEKILILKENEVIKDGVVVELNPAYEEDKIRLMQRNLEELDENQKIEYQKENKKYSIVEKTMIEKLEEEIITQEEYNNHIINIRQAEYSSKLDGKRAELLESVLHNLSSQGLLTEIEQSLLEELNRTRLEIKESNPKAEKILN